MIAIAPALPDSPDARRLLNALDDELRRRYPGWRVHGIRPEDVAHPRFIFLVARANGRAIGCGAIRTLDSDTAEVKRMFVVDEWRRRGVARQLLEALEAQARERGFAQLRLETGALQPEAIALYRSAGYADTIPYGEYVGNPVSVYLEKQLTSSSFDKT